MIRIIRGNPWTTCAAVLVASSVLTLLTSMSPRVRTEGNVVVPAQVIVHPSSSNDLPVMFDELDAAVASDPFHPLRRPPEVRFNPEHDSAPTDAFMPVQPLTLPSVVLLGTTTGGDVSMAVLQVGDAPARLVAQGDTVQGLRVRRIGADHALLEWNDSSLTVFLKYAVGAH